MNRKSLRITPVDVADTGAGASGALVLPEKAHVRHGRPGNEVADRIEVVHPTREIAIRLQSVKDGTEGEQPRITVEGEDGRQILLQIDLIDLATAPAGEARIIKPRLASVCVNNVTQRAYVMMGGAFP